MITLEQAVKNCRLITDKPARLSCYDGVIDAASAPSMTRSLMPMQATPVPLAPAPIPSASAPPVAPLAAAPQAAPKPPAPAPAPMPSEGGNASIDGLVVQIADASRNGNQVLSVVSATGETWVQADSVEFTQLPKSGDQMLVTTNVFGKHTCHINRLPAFTCKVRK